MYLVNKVIAKCEKSQNDWRKGSTGRRTIKIQQLDYDKCGKTELLEEVRLLEAMDLLTVEKWVIRGSDVERIAFRLENLPKYYQLAKENGQNTIWPKQEKVEYYTDILKNELKKDYSKEWIVNYYQYLLSKVEQGDFQKTIQKDLNEIAQYTAALKGIDELKEPIYKRVFSKKYLRNSKKFEKEIEKHVITIARKYWTGLDDGMDDKTVLAQLLIEEYSQELEIKGPLRIQTQKEDKEIFFDFSDFIYGATLNSAMLKNCKIVENQPDIKRVITIENKANFVSVPYDPQTLYIFSHGYFSPKERDFLIELRKTLEGKQVEYFHSGDLDYGGIYIFKYIEKYIFTELMPYMMGEEIYEKYWEYGEEIEEETLKKLKLLKHPKLQQLIDKIIEKQKVIEQESFLVL